MNLFLHQEEQYLYSNKIKSILIKYIFRIIRIRVKLGLPNRAPILPINNLSSLVKIASLLPSQYIINYCNYIKNIDTTIFIRITAITSELVKIVYYNYNIKNIYATITIRISKSTVASTTFAFIKNTRNIKLPASPKPEIGLHAAPSKL